MELAQLCKISGGFRAYSKSSGLTKAQHRVLEVIRYHWLRWGYSPSYRDIGEELGISSSSTVHSHVQTLIKKGFLAKVPNKPRCITLVQRVEVGNYPSRLQVVTA